MKKALLLFICILGLSRLTFASECSTKVLSYHQDQYELTYLKSQDAFIDYFIKRQNLLHHIFAYPEAALTELATPNENFIAYNFVERAKKLGITEDDIIATYSDSLDSGELCKSLGEKYKNPRKIRKYLYKKLKI